MDKTDKEFIDRNVENESWMKDKEWEGFIGEVFLSTDGKQTVHFKAWSDMGRTLGAKWAVLVYDKLIAKYGTKQSQAVREYSQKAQTKEDYKKQQQANCEHEKQGERVSQSEKNPGKKYKYCLVCNKFMGWSNGHGQ